MKWQFHSKEFLDYCNFNYQGTFFGCGHPIPIIEDPLQRENSSKLLLISYIPKCSTKKPENLNFMNQIHHQFVDYTRLGVKVILTCRPTQGSNGAIVVQQAFFHLLLKGALTFGRCTSNVNLSSSEHRLECSFTQFFYGFRDDWPLGPLQQVRQMLCRKLQRLRRKKIFVQQNLNS